MGPVAAEVELDEAAVGGLEASLRGQLVRPSTPDYDEHRKVWNGSIDRSPALIARCAGVADVIAAVGFARENGLATRRPRRRAQLPRACPSATAAS